MADSTGRVPTWRDGVVLPLTDRAQLDSEQWRLFADDSVVHDLAEVDQMPEPMRSWARQVITAAQARAETRIGHQERREAS